MKIHCSQFWRLKIQDKYGQVLMRALFLLAGCWLLIASSWGGMVEPGFWGLFSKVPNPSWEPRPHDLIISPRPHLPKPSLWGLGFQLTNLGRHKHSNHSKWTSMTHCPASIVMIILVQSLSPPLPSSCIILKQIKDFISVNLWLFQSVSLKDKDLKNQSHTFVTP